MTPHLSELITKIFLTILLCGLIGGEREMRQKGAGLRTHILVGVGSMLIVLTSFHVFDIYKHVTIVDPTRMIAGLVQGIGFLCAGTIIRGGGPQVSGLTTAATLWIVSGIGMSVGVGQYDTAIIFTAVTFLVLTGIRSVERKLSEGYFKKKGGG